MKVISLKSSGCSLLAVLIVLFLLPIRPALAHLATIGYSDISAAGSAVRYQLYLDPQEVAQWMDMTSGRTVFVIEPGASTAKARTGVPGWSKEELQRLVDDCLTITSGGVSVKPEITEASMRNRGGAQYLYLDMTGEFPAAVHSFDIGYNFL